MTRRIFALLCLLPTFVFASFHGSAVEAVSPETPAGPSAKTSPQVSSASSPKKASNASDAPKGKKGGNKSKTATALSREIERIIEGSPLAEARVGIEVVSLETGKVIYARNADELLNPASNTKVFTSAAALAILGPAFRFTTEFFVDEDPLKIQTKEKKKNLYVRGGGDPSITTEQLWRIVNDLYDRGLRNVSGDIVLDERFFDRDFIGEGFDQEVSDHAYMAPPSALALNWNTVGIHIWPGAKSGRSAFITIDPESDYISLSNKVSTRSKKAVRRLIVSISPTANGAKDVVTATGRLPVGSGEVHVWRKVSDPGLYFGHTLKRFMQLRGIQVKGTVRRGDVPEKNVTRLLSHKSSTLDAILKLVNKNSSNMVAESLVKTLGALVFGTPGSWKTGLYAIERYLAVEVGLKPGTYVMKNGSGLNDVNRFSAHQVNQMLLTMWRNFPTAPEFMSSLGIAGMDGTVQYRMVGTAAEGRLRAKTGTLENVTALSGYVQNAGGEKWAFSVIANDFPGRAWKVVPLLDEISAAVAAQGDATSKQGIRSNLAASLTPLNRLAAELLALDDQAFDRDANQLPALYARLSRERDPAMKALVASVIFQSAPTNREVARTFMKHFDASNDCLGRLAKAAKQASVPTPLISSLAQLASDGNADALSKLLALAGRDAALDDGTDSLFTDVNDAMVEVAFNAPEAVFAALKNLSDGGAQTRAVSALAKVISVAEIEAASHDESSGESVVPHPFRALVTTHLADPTSKVMTGAPVAFVDALTAAFLPESPQKEDAPKEPSPVVAEPKADKVDEKLVSPSASPAPPSSEPPASSEPAVVPTEPEAPAVEDKVHSTPGSVPDASQTGV